MDFQLCTRHLYSTAHYKMNHLIGIHTNLIHLRLSGTFIEKFGVYEMKYSLFLVSRITCLD